MVNSEGKANSPFVCVCVTQPHLFNCKTLHAVFRWDEPVVVVACCCLPAVDLTSVLTPEVMAPILANPEVQQRLMPYLPSGESLPQSCEELSNTLNSPQFQQVERDHC